MPPVVLSVPGGRRRRPYVAGGTSSSGYHHQRLSDRAVFGSAHGDAFDGGNVIPFARGGIVRSADALSDGARHGADGRGRAGSGDAAEAACRPATSGSRPAVSAGHRQRHQQQPAQGDAPRKGATNDGGMTHQRDDRRGRAGDGATGARRPGTTLEPGAVDGGQPGAGALMATPSGLPACRRNRWAPGLLARHRRTWSSARRWTSGRRRSRRRATAGVTDFEMRSSG